MLANDKHIGIRFRIHSGMTFQDKKNVNIRTSSSSSGELDMDIFSSILSSTKLDVVLSMAVPLSEGVNSFCKSASSRSDRCKFMCDKRMNEGKKKEGIPQCLVLW